MYDQKSLLQFLEHHHIDFLDYEHPPVYTCEEASRYLSSAPGSGSKNLVLRDQKGRRFFFVMTSDDKKVNLKQLGVILNTKLSFASSEILNQLLGVEAGAVTILGLINDAQKQLEVYVDRDIWGSAQVHCHPLVNTATLILSHTALERFLLLTGHTINIIDLPADSL